MHSPLSDAALDQIFRTARTYRRSAEAWLPKPVTGKQIREIYDLAKLGPTSTNCSPARIVFVKSAEAKEKQPALGADNVAQTMAPPSAMPRCRGPISSLPRARWVWTAGRCPDFTTPASTTCFLPAAPSNPIS